MKYQELVDVYEALESTTKRLEKTEIISNFLKELDSQTTEKVGLLILGVVFPDGVLKKLELGLNWLRELLQKLLRLVKMRAEIGRASCSERV